MILPLDWKRKVMTVLLLLLLSSSLQTIDAISCYTNYPNITYPASPNTCEGDMCGAWTAKSRTVKPEHFTDQFCVANVTAFVNYDGCYDDYGKIDCLCSTDYCNSHSLFEAPVKTPITRKCFVGTPDECEGVICNVFKPYGMDTFYRECHALDVMSDRRNNADIFPDVLVQRLSFAWLSYGNSSDNSTPLEFFDSEMSCTSENCEQQFNKSLANFSIFSRPLVKCIIREIGDDGVFFDGICLGHFCYLTYDLLEDYYSIYNETYYYYGCWRVDGTLAIWNMSTISYTSGFRTTHLCDWDYCNDNTNTTGGGEIVIKISQSTSEISVLASVVFAIVFNRNF